MTDRISTNVQMFHYLPVSAVNKQYFKVNKMLSQPFTSGEIIAINKLYLLQLPLFSHEIVHLL